MINTKVVNNALIAVVLAVSLTACGFHLRGNIPLPDGVKNMYLAAPLGSFREQLEGILANGGAELAAAKANSDIVLNITQARSDRAVGTLDDRGKVNSYDVIFTVEYDLERPDGTLVRSESLSETRRYNFNPESVIESESEEAELIESMEQDLSLRIVRQLSSMVDYSVQSSPAAAN